MTLDEERCEACRPDSPMVSPDEEPALLAEVPEWTIVDVKGEHRLKRVFAFPGWDEALAFTEAVGAAAAEEDHHPKLVTEWGKVTVWWWTHAIHGLHRNDFIMAARSDALFAGQQDDASD